MCQIVLQVLDPELEIADHAFPPESSLPSAPKIQVKICQPYVVFDLRNCKTAPPTQSIWT